MSDSRQRVSNEDQPIVSTPLSTQLYDRILSRISTGVYSPGKQLKELELCKEFNVSRTPLREALFRLVDYGVVENSGRIARVAVLSERDVKELFEVRRVLELEAIRLAFGKLTADDFDLLDQADPGEYRDSPDFVVACQDFDLRLHRTIGARSGNGLLARKLRKLHDRVQLVCRPTVERLHEHRDIVEALRSGDRRAAIHAMKVHLGLALKSQLKKASADAAAATGVRRA
jgi:DNA-binding GntR family transcriptional regulator